MRLFTGIGNPQSTLLQGFTGVFDDNANTPIQQLNNELPTEPVIPQFPLSDLAGRGVKGQWRLEITGLVQTRQTYKLDRLKALPAIEQETTLMCISNGLDAGLMSNAVWKGIVLRDLIDPSGPLADVRRVRLYGVDNYTDTIPIEKALEPTTLLAWEMNGKKLPDRHGYPLRAIVPGYFGEKHVKWLTRIELTGPNAKGFYETQGWGPDFITPTRSSPLPRNNSTPAMSDKPSWDCPAPTFCAEAAEPRPVSKSTSSPACL